MTEQENNLQLNEIKTIFKKIAQLDRRIGRLVFHLLGVYLINEKAVDRGIEITISDYATLVTSRCLTKINDDLALYNLLNSQMLLLKEIIVLESNAGSKMHYSVNNGILNVKFPFWFFEAFGGKNPFALFC